MRCVSRHFLSRGTAFFRGGKTGSEAAISAAGHAGHCIRGNARSRRAVYAARKGEHGSAILESFLCMLLLGLILFGVLQLFQLVLADMVTDYAAFRGARSAAVGFSQIYARHEALIKTAPVSGSLVSPDPGSYPGWNGLRSQQALLEDFMRDGNRQVEYAYWNGEGDSFHTNYHCMYYGEPLIIECPLCTQTKKTHLLSELNAYGKHASFSLKYINYPLNIPLHEWLTGHDSITISAESELTNHSSAFLE